MLFVSQRATFLMVVRDAHSMVIFKNIATPKNRNIDFDCKFRLFVTYIHTMVAIAMMAVNIATLLNCIVGNTFFLYAMINAPNRNKNSRLTCVTIPHSIPYLGIRSNQIVIHITTHTELILSN